MCLFVDKKLLSKTNKGFFLYSQKKKVNFVTMKIKIAYTILFTKITP